MPDGTVVAETRVTPAQPESNLPARVESQPVITPDMQNDIVQTATQGINEGKKGDPRRVLILVRDLIKRNLAEAKGKKPNKGLEDQLKTLQESKDPQDQALALDFQIAQKQYELGQIDNAIASYQAELGKPDITAEARAKCESAVEELQAEKDGIKGEDGKIEQKGVSQTIVELRTERENIPGDIPNSVQRLASILGVTPQEAETNPLQAMMNQLDTAIVIKAGAIFIDKVKAAGLPQEGIDVLKDIFRVIRGEPTTIEKTAKGAMKFVGILGILQILMIWLASKQSSQGQAMG